MLGEYLNKFVIAYLNNIIIYFNTKEEHKKHVKWVLKKLYKENIPITVEKYKFHTKKTDFIGFIIKPRQININLKKIKAIIKQRNPESIIRLRSFLRFCNYYKKFIVKWLEKTELFIRIMKKDKL